jgi:hypothetical protein
MGLPRDHALSAQRMGCYLRASVFLSYSLFLQLSLLIVDFYLSQQTFYDFERCMTEEETYSTQKTLQQFLTEWQLFLDDD